MGGKTIDPGLLVDGDQGAVAATAKALKHEGRDAAVRGLNDASIWKKAFDSVTDRISILSND